jgi:hypothetical protein
MVNCGRITALAGVGLLAWLVGAAQSETPPAPPKPAGPTVARVSGPYTHANLTVFLLHGPDTLPDQKLLTLQEALEQKKAIVHETEQVNELAVENLAGDTGLYLQSGDIVKGGKQDRAIAYDLILPPKSGKVPIGSFCVEAGRWRQRGREAAGTFGTSAAQAPGKDLKLAINGAARQDQVWQKVKEAQDKLSKNVGKPVASGESATSLQLALEDKQLLEKLSAYEKALAGAAEGKADVIGVALAVNGKVEGAEVYGSAALFKKLWPKLLKSAATDALAELDEKKPFEAATAKGVEAFLADAAAGPAKEVALADGRAQRGEAMINAPAQAGQALARPADRAPQAGGQPGAAAPAAPAVAQRVRIVRYDGGKVLLVECQDKEQAQPSVIHRSYIAK